MDIKSKKFKYSSFVIRWLAFILCIMLLAVAGVGTMVMVTQVEERYDGYISLEDLLRNQNYLQSADLQEELRSTVHTLQDMMTRYKSEEYIKSGKALSTEEGQLAEAIQSLYYEGYYYCGEKRVDAVAITTDGVVIKSNDEDTAYLTSEGELDISPDLKKAFISANQKQITEIKAYLIKLQLRDFDRAKERLEEKEGLNYFVTDGRYVISGADVRANTDGEEAAVNPAQFEKQPAYVIYADGRLTKIPESAEASQAWLYEMDQNMEDELFNQSDEGFKLYLSFDSGFINRQQEAYQNAAGSLKFLPWILAAAFGSFILLIYLMVATGGKREDGSRKLYAVDRIWTELQLTLIGCAVMAGIAVAYAFISYWLYVASTSMTVLEISTAGVSWAAIGAVGLWFILSCVRLLKARLFIRSSLCYKLWNLVIHKWVGSICRSIGKIFRGSSLMKKVVICTLGVCLLSATVFLAPVVFLAIIVFAPKFVKQFEEVKKGVEEVRNGNLSYKIPVLGNSELDKLAENINEISEASGIAIQNELKNQRMKTELISNVSHDLKTPLTSLVTYIDLLKKEGLDSENAPEYLRILDEKTERLRNLTEDLFEAAKASSGAMPVQMEKVELLSLIHQGLGELDTKIKASGLDFILKAEEEKYYVMADGKLLWRVVENLLVNVLKYALENSRVYIDIRDIKTKSDRSASLITMEIKNISKNPLNISADELMERFKRGDESRTTDGSGLGLAIAKDLVKLQDGWFEIFIDGDLFKAQVMLTKYKEEDEK